MLPSQEQEISATHRADSTHVLISLSCRDTACVCLELCDDVHQAAVLHTLDPATRTRLDLDGCGRLPHVLSVSGTGRDGLETPGNTELASVRHINECESSGQNTLKK